MTRSLQARWTLALVAVCVVQAGLVAWAVHVATRGAFEAFLVEEAHTGMVGHVTAWVRETGSIDGFVPPARRGAGRPPGGKPGGPPERGLGPPPAQPGRRLPPPFSAGAPVRFGLADLDGRLLLPYAGLHRGDVLPPDLLAEGRPLLVDGETVGFTFVPDDPVPVLSRIPDGSPEAHFLRATAAALAWGLAGGLVLALALGVWLAGRIVGPIRQLTAAADRVALGDLGQAVPVRADDEVGRLADAFNAMSARLAEATALRRRMTADLSHDLRTPLTAILGTLEAIRDGALPATTERIAVAHAEAARLNRLVEDLHTLALADARELGVHARPVEVGDALRRAARAFDPEASAAAVGIDVNALDGLWVEADPDRLAQILGNLLGNALRHTPRGGRVTLRARPDGSGVEVAVIDTGEGIPPDVLPVVFERSVRADAARASGSAGLGLSIVRSLAEAMGGRARAESALGEGTTVTVWLPRAGRPCDGAREGTQSETARDAI